MSARRRLRQRANDIQGAGQIGGIIADDAEAAEVKRVEQEARLKEQSKVLDRKSTRLNSSH